MVIAMKTLEMIIYYLKQANDNCKEITLDCHILSIKYGLVRLWNKHINQIVLIKMNTKTKIKDGIVLKFPY